jgi:hypothetical protein
MIIIYAGILVVNSCILGPLGMGFTMHHDSEGAGSAICQQS